MNTNEKKNTNNARQLTLAELEALPIGSVIWIAWTCEEENGLIWHSIFPAMVYVSGKDGHVIGADCDSLFDLDMASLLKDDFTAWSKKPDDSMIPGLTEDEYNALPEEALAQI